MNWKLEAASLGAIDLSEGKAGTIFVLSDQMARELKPMLMLAGPEGHFTAIELAGDEAFVLRHGKVSPDQGTIIPLWHGDFEVELPAALRSDGGRMESLSSLVVSPLGAFVTVRRTVNGFDQAAYASLSDWKIIDRPGQPSTTFSKWRLNLAAEGMGPGRTIIEVGDWSEPN